MRVSETQRSNEKVRLAVLGAGAVAELCHLPAAADCPQVEIAALVDTNIERARRLADQFSIGVTTADYRDLFGTVDGVINALPHHVHANVSIEFLERRTPVLVEKPMAISAEQARGMADAARANGTVLQVGLMYRFCRGVATVRRFIEDDLLGGLRAFELESGFIYDWPVASGFFFDRRKAGGGVLIDTGSHMLDLLIGLIGPVVDFEYRDDLAGGVEADCHLSLTLQAPSGPVTGAVTLSRLRNLLDVLRITGERLTIEYDLSAPDAVRIRPTRLFETGESFIPDTEESDRQTWGQVYVEQLAAFASAVRGGDCRAAGQDVIESMALICECYRRRERLERPWNRSQPGGKLETREPCDAHS